MDRFCKTTVKTVVYIINGLIEEEKRKKLYTILVESINKKEQDINN